MRGAQIVLSGRLDWRQNMKQVVENPKIKISGLLRQDAQVRWRAFPAYRSDEQP